MKKRVKSTILLLIALLAIMSLTGCPPQITPPGEILSAKEAWEIMKSSQETLPDDTVPVYIQGRAYYPERPIKDGKSHSWEIGFYSEKESKVWNVGYYSHKTESGVSPKPTSAEERYSDVSLIVNDLTDWDIDSPKACEIAAQNGAGETPWIYLRTARLDSLEDDYSYLNTPDFIPDSTKLFWMINDEKYSYFIDANTGEYLGRYAT